MKIYNVDAKARVAQRYILATLYYATNGTGWKVNTNWGDGHECEWHCVCCEIGENNMTSVTYLDLNSNNLVGSLPQEIGYIGRLEQSELHILFSENKKVKSRVIFNTVLTSLISPSLGQQLV